MSGLTAQEWAAKCSAETYQVCSKCSGKGEFYDHMPGWPGWMERCYRCNGSGRTQKGKT